jgi:hypothetical protein
VEGRQGKDEEQAGSPVPPPPPGPPPDFEAVKQSDRDTFNKIMEWWATYLIAIPMVIMALLVLALILSLF